MSWVEASKLLEGFDSSLRYARIHPPAPSSPDWGWETFAHWAVNISEAWAQGRFDEGRVATTPEIMRKLAQSRRAQGDKNAKSERASRGLKFSIFLDRSRRKRLPGQIILNVYAHQFQPGLQSLEVPPDSGPHAVHELRFWVGLTAKPVTHLDLCLRDKLSQGLLLDQKTTAKVF